jgi:integrase
MTATARRGHGEGSVYRDAANGTWVGAISLGWRPDGSRMRRKVTGRTKTEVREKLKKLQAEADAGLKTSASYTVSKAVDDWAAEALDGLADKTVRSHVDLLRPVTMLIGNVPLRDLTAQDVRRTLSKLAQTRSTRTMASTHNVLVRAIRHAEANDHVGRNVASLVKPPQGKTGRPSRAMTAAEAAALLVAAKDHPRLGAYVILSLTTGIRTEEARALRWDHVDLDGDPDARTPVPPSIAVWRSVRLHGDTKTEKSRRTLALPQSAVAALREHRKWQASSRLAAGRCGRTPAWCSPRAWERRWTPRMSGATSAPCARRLASKVSGRRGSSGTRSYRSCPCPAWLSRRSPAWPDTPAPVPPRPSTGTSSVRSSPPVPTSWTRSSPRLRARDSQPQPVTLG